MLTWIKRILMVIGVYVVLNYLGLWTPILDLLWDMPKIVGAAVGLLA
ncbi:MAG: hypothetical protein HY363_02580 [Candidatus Aenigmarchaeota archaeon]|nr:hypothetical protein [Candidatus Aenigmarchaeota archaeon]